MIKLVAQTGKVYACYVDGLFHVGNKVYLPDNADVTCWQEFDSEDNARASLGVTDILEDTL